MTLQQVIRSALMLVVTLAPLPFASNRPWSWNLLAGLIAVITLLWSIYWVVSQKRLKRLPPRLALWAFAAALLWAGLQALTPGFLSAWTHPVWLMAGAELPEMKVSAYISLAPDNTIDALIRLLSYGMVFWLAFQLSIERHDARWMLSWLTGAGFLYAFYGLIVHWGGYQTILWFSKWASAPENLNSTFVNKNHFATYAGLILLCAVMLLFQNALQNKLKPMTVYTAPYKGVWRELELALAQNWVLLLAIIIILTALLLSNSRGGVLSTIFGIWVLILAMWRQPDKLLKYFVILLGIIIIVVFFTYYWSGVFLSQSWEQVSVDKSVRESVYHLVGRAIEDNPWAGFGLGTFEDSFRLYRDETIPISFPQAHNVYLESLFELGVPAASLLLLSIFSIVLRCAWGFFLRRHAWLYPALGVAASVLAGVHSLVDFSLQIPAVAVTYACILGIACAQAYSSR